MKIRRLAALIPVLCAGTSSVSLSQTADSSVHAGDRIRVQRFDARHPRVGKFVASSDDSLTVEWPNGARESMPMFEVGQVDVSVGHRHHFVRGAAYGLAAGAALGLIIRNTVDKDRLDSSGPKTTTGTGAMLVTLGGSVIFGAATGALGTEEWEPTSLGKARSRVGLVVPVSRRGAGLGISAAF